MLKKPLTNAETAAMLTNLEAGIKNKTKAELGSKDVRSKIAATAGANVSADKFDAEEFAVDFSVLKKAPNRDADTKVIGTRDFTPHTFESGALDVESFDSLNTQVNDEVRLAAINIISANALSSEDGIINLCSIATVAPNETGKKLVANAPMVTYGAANKNGVAMGGTKVALISNLDNNEVFASVRLPYKPVLRQSGDYQTARFLQTQVTENINYGGEKVTTAPILVGADVDLRLLCSSTSYLSENGLMLNPGVTLSEDGGLDDVYVTLANETGLKNILKFAVAGEKGTRFSSIGTGDGKDLTLNYKGVTTIKVSEMVASGMVKWSSTADTYVLDNNDLEVTIGYSISMNANTDSLALSASATKLQLVKLTTVGNVELTSGTVFDGIKEIIELSAVTSFYPRTFLSNTNNIDNGLLIDMDIQNFEIPAVCKTPVTIRKSVLGDVSATDVAGILNAAKIANNAVKATEVLDAIDRFIGSNAGKADPITGIIENVKMEGVGGRYVKPAIVAKNITATLKANMRSAEAKEDISSYILDKITAYAIDLYAATNFDKAMSTIAQGEKAVLSIVAGTQIASYLKYAVEKGVAAGLDFDVEVSKSSRLTKRVLATFKIGKEVYEFSPIILAQSPDFFYKGVETTNNGSQAVTKLIPRRNIVVNSGIFLDFTVEQTVEAFDN